MVYYNASKRARHATSTMNQNSGGGDKKAGFPYMIGRGYLTSIALRSTEPISGGCCTLTKMNMTMKTANASRGIGSVGAAANSYWHIPNT
jgi:hypothetical protein